MLQGSEMGKAAGEACSLAGSWVLTHLWSGGGHCHTLLIITPSCSGCSRQGWGLISTPAASPLQGQAEGGSSDQVLG